MTTAIQQALIPIISDEEPSLVMSALIAATVRTGMFYLDCDAKVAAETVIKTLKDAIRTGMN